MGGVVTRFISMLNTKNIGYHNDIDDDDTWVDIGAREREIRSMRMLYLGMMGVPVTIYTSNLTEVIEFDVE